MSGTKQYPSQTTLRYDPSRRMQAQAAFRHHRELVGRSDEEFSFNDVVDMALQLLIEMQGDVEASSGLFKATAMEEIMRSHVLLQGQLEAIHELLFAIRNPAPGDEPGRQQWAANAVKQIEAQVSAGVRRTPLLHKAILRDEKQIAESIRRRRETLRAAIRIVREKVNEESVVEAMQRAADEKS